MTGAPRALRHPTETAEGIRYVEAGPAQRSATTYLLVHGLGGSLEQWVEVIDGLAPVARTIAIDIPGFGQSRTKRGEFDLTAAVGRIARFLDAKGIDRCVVVTHSISCVVGAGLAALRPETVSRLILVSGALIRASEIAQRPATALRDRRLGLMVIAQFAAGVLPVPQAVLRLMARSPLVRRATLWPFVADPAHMPTDHLVEMLTGSGSLAVLRILLSAKSIEFENILSSVTQPVELITGVDDRLVTPVDFTRLRRMMSVVHESTIDECGHWPWLEQPDRLVSCIRLSEPQ